MRGTGDPVDRYEWYERSTHLRIQICRHPDVQSFAQKAKPWLLESEAEHNLLLGLVPRLAESDDGFEPPIYLATIEADGKVVGCAFRTPPHKLGLT